MNSTQHEQESPSEFPTISPFITEGRRLADAATAPPWFNNGRDIDTRFFQTVAIPVASQDADFISDSRTRLPMALDALQIAVEALQRFSQSNFLVADVEAKEVLSKIQQAITPKP